MIKIVAIGKIKEKPMQQIIGEYQKRLKPIHKIELIELTNTTIDDESKRILEKIAPKDCVILLDLKGRDLSSVDMSKYLIDNLDRSLDVVFVIGGSDGVSELVRSRANMLWRISNLTFTHQMVRMLIYEQIYRMFMISKNHPYHK